MSVRAEPIATEHSRARWAMVALGANAVLGAIAVLLGIVDLMLLLSAQSSGIGTIDEALDDPSLAMVWLIEGGLGILQFLAFVGAAVFLLMWVYQAYKNLTALGVRKQDLKYSPGWAVGVFLIPFVNLVLPFLVVRGIDTRQRESASRGPAEGMLPQTASTPYC